MKLPLISFLFLFSSLVFASPVHVVIDPGHGGTDAGATQGIYKESEIALSVSLELARRLEDDPRFKVTLTRSKDEALSLDQRGQIAKRSEGDLFLSIHLNSAVTPKAKGTEFYIQNQFPPDEESLFLANRENRGVRIGEKQKELGDVQSILKDLKRSHDLHSSLILAQQLKKSWPQASAIRQAPFHVLFEAPMPSTLVELGYLTHPEEGEWLHRADSHKTLAERIYKGLVKYVEKM